MMELQNGVYEITKLLAEAKEMLSSLPSEIYVTLIERNVDENEDHMEVLTKKYNSNTLPTFVIDDEVYRGFDENIGKIMGHLGL
ncbi:glutaredoxin family protein [Bacillus wiedmannii]|uniref:glutaredoxin family protein n=1 Tax=Bacillus wiedmannii TaxID=1890302 RepID=UPI0028532837|nr:glutaredoxin family protein [Bacillus wiedmannii]MDR4942980.1 glutaredoxin family protein [Bacillus wiedmannii]